MKKNEDNKRLQLYILKKSKKDILFYIKNNFLFY